ARPLLERLGAWERFVESGHLVSYGNRSAWGSEELADDDFIFDPHGPGWHLNRGSFDALLRERAADAGTTRWRQARLTGALRRRHGGWVLTVQGPEGAATIDASGVIDATGRTSLVARWQGQQRRYDDHLVGVVARLEAPGDRAW